MKRNQSIALSTYKTFQVLVVSVLLLFTFTYAEGQDKKKQPLFFVKSKAKAIKGSILLIPGGDYTKIPFKNEGLQMASFLNKEGFDVAVLHYNSDQESQNKALKSGLEAFKLLKLHKTVPALRGQKLNLIGFSSGAHLASRMVQRLPEALQPDQLLLIAPTKLNETLPGTVFPEVMPPVKTKAQLLCVISALDSPHLAKSCTEYTKTWIGYGGQASIVSLPSNPGSSPTELRPLIKAFLNQKTAKKDSLNNPAAIAVAGRNLKRHQEKIALVANKKYDLILIGNSITHNLDKPQYEPVWSQYFAPRNALNLGFSGYRTENLLWNIENGELAGQSPKVIILEIGTNNIDEKNYPTRHTASQLAGGITAIVNLLRQKLPDTKIIVMRCFPGCYGGPNPTSHRAILERASDLVAKIADHKHVFYCDVNHVFLNMDGSINQQQMPDWLHPSLAGAKDWAEAMEPLLSQLMGDRSLSTRPTKNTATIPVPVLENNSYNWWQRHEEVLRIKDALNPEIVLIGNSITHLWGGDYPKLLYTDGKARVPNGPKSWNSVFAPYRVLNLGFGWDRTQNALWRLDHGEIDGLHPKIVVIDIGTNNTSQTANAKANTVDEITEGIKAVCLRVRSKIPNARLVLMDIFPREKDPLAPRRKMITEINQQLQQFAAENKITLVDIGPDMLEADGSFKPGMMLDFTHPTDKGYQIWADHIRSLINEP